MIDIHIVDAFITEKPFSGNPAGVCILNEFIPEMQEIASEINLSETAFVVPNQGSYKIRWFTPISEAPICGHATLASMHTLIEEGLENGKEVTFFSNTDTLHAYKIGNDIISLDFPSYEVIDIKEDAIYDVLSDISTPMYIGYSQNCILLELHSGNDVINLKPNLHLLSQLPYRALIVTSVDDVYYQYDFLLRYFAPKVGIDEDPACGSAHTRLVPYWHKKLNKNNFASYQPSRRGGVIKCEYKQNRVIISGRSKTFLKGKITI